MPRFYFHFASKDRLIRDDHGTELRTLASAHLHALQLIVRTLRLMNGAARERWTVQIADHAGEHLLTVLFPVVPRGREAFGRRGRDDGRASAGTSLAGTAGAEDTPAILRSCAAALRDRAEPPDG